MCRAELSPENVLKLCRSRAEKGSAKANMELAGHLDASGDVDGAESAYRAAIAIDPQRVNAYYSLAALLMKRADVSLHVLENTCLELLRTALRIDPNFLLAKHAVEVISKILRGIPPAVIQAEMNNIQNG